MAQNNNPMFMLSVMGDMYFHQKKSTDYYLYPTPKIEILYKIKSFETLTFFTGIQYAFSYGHHDLGYKSQWRRIGHELVFPLYINQDIGKYVSLNGGAAIGYLMKGKVEYKNNIPALKEWKDVTDQTNYDESAKFYLAFYIDLQVKYDFDTMNTISIGPTIKYYAKDNWMMEVRNKTLIGLSLKYSVRF